MTTFATFASIRSLVPPHESSCRATTLAPRGPGSYLRSQASQATPANFAAALGHRLVAVLDSTHQAQGRPSHRERCGTRSDVSTTEQRRCRHERRSEPVQQARVRRLRPRTMFPWRRGFIVGPVPLPRQGSPGMCADVVLERHAPHVVRRSTRHARRVGPQRRDDVGTTVVRQVIDQEGRSPDARLSRVGDRRDLEERERPWIR